MTRIIYPLSYLSLPALFVGTLMLAIGIKGDPFNLSLAGMGCLVMLLAALTAPRPGHPVHDWLMAKFSPDQTAPSKADIVETERKTHEAAELLQTVASYNLAVGQHEPQPQPYHSDKARADLIIAPSVSARSWIGGLPQMPEGIEWPVKNDYHSLFMAQIALEDLPQGLWNDLGPRTGWLLFFWGGRDNGGAKVIHINELGPERRYPGYEGVRGFLTQDAWGALNALGRSGDGFVPTKWGLNMSAMKSDAQGLPTLREKMGMLNSPLKDFASLDFSSESFGSLLAHQEEPPEAYVVSFLAREAYARDPGTLDPFARDIFENVWRFEAAYEVPTLGGPVSKEYFYTKADEPVLLMEFPPNHLVGFSVGSSGFGYFINPEDLQAGRFDKAWLDVKN